QKRIDELPMELLRKIVEPLGPKDRCNVRLCNRTMEEAVATSKAHFVSARIGYSLCSLQIEIWYETRRLFVNVNRDEQWRNRLFEKLSVEFLTLEDVRGLEMPVVNSFFDNCTFDSLTVHLSRNQWPCSRSHELIRKAVKNLQISCINLFIPTAEQFISISRPATFYIWEEWKPADELFLILLRRGHSFPDSVFEPQSQHSLMEAIKIVSEAMIAQRVFIIVLKKYLCQHLLK
ncbi:hypothetical protein PENTCL1PPCAC_7680, partial [Pristionchus entomophagus]